MNEVKTVTIKRFKFKDIGNGEFYSHMSMKKAKRFFCLTDNEMTQSNSSFGGLLGSFEGYSICLTGWNGDSCWYNYKNVVVKVVIK